GNLMYSSRHVRQLERSTFVGDGEPWVIEHHDGRRHVRMNLAEHFDHARFVEALAAALPLGKAAEVDRVGARQREHVVVDGSVVGKIDGRSDGYGDNPRYEVFVAPSNFRVHRRRWRAWGVLQIDDDMPQLGFGRQSDCWEIAGVG